MPILLPAPTPPRLVSVAPEYGIEARVSPAERRVYVEGTVMLLPSAIHKGSVSVLLTKAASSVQVSVLGANERSIVRSEPHGPDLRWIVATPRQLGGKSRVTLKFKYELGEKAGPQFELSPESSIASGYGTNWYPNTELDRGVGELRIKAPGGYTAIANGKPLAGSEVCRMARPGTFNFAVGRYIRTSGERVDLYMLRQRSSARAWTRSADRVLETLTRIYGKYPFARLSLVEVPADQASRQGFLGASVDGMIYVSRAMLDKPFQNWYFGHEMSHQWWGNSVRPSSDVGRYLLTESLAHYGGLRTTVEIEGEEAAERFRRGGADGGGLGYLVIASAGLDQRLDRVTGEMGTRLAWSKGFLLFDGLAQWMGRSAFEACLRRIAKRHEFSSLTWSDFLREVGGEGSAFAQRWVQEGVPDYKVRWSQQGRTVRAVISQTGKPFPAVVTVEARGYRRERRSVQARIRASRSAVSIVIPLTFRAKEVVLDPYFEVLHWTDEYRGRARASAVFVKAMVAEAQGGPAAAEAILTEAARKIDHPDRYGMEFGLHWAWGRLEMHQSKWSEAKAHLLQALASPSRDESSLAWAYLDLATVAKNLGDKELLDRAISGAESAEPGGDAGKQAKQLREVVVPKDSPASPFVQP